MLVSTLGTKSPDHEIPTIAVLLEPVGYCHSTQLSFCPWLLNSRTVVGAKFAIGQSFLSVCGWTDDLGRGDTSEQPLAEVHIKPWSG